MLVSDRIPLGLPIRETSGNCNLHAIGFKERFPPMSDVSALAQQILVEREQKFDVVALLVIFHLASLLD